MKKCQILIPFQGTILTVEELGGINNDFIVFNPDRSTGKPDYKLQTTDSMLLRFENETNLVSILDYPDEFIIINSKGEIITDSSNVNPEFVDMIMDSIVNDQGINQETPRKDLN